MTPISRYRRTMRRLIARARRMGLQRESETLRAVRDDATYANLRRLAERRTGTAAWLYDRAADAADRLAGATAK